MSTQHPNYIAAAILDAAGLDKTKATRLVLESAAGEVETLTVTYYTNGFTEPPTLLKLKVEPL